MNTDNATQGRDLAIYLNHLYLVPDEQTYQDISQSEFLRNEFAGFSQRTTISKEESWTGTYLNGETTYIEFLKAQEPGITKGNCGIGFGVDRPGELKLVQERMQELIKVPVKRSLTTMKRGTEDIPWFHSVGVDYPDRDWSFDIWVMEYHKDHLKTRYPNAFSVGDITRKQYNSRRFSKERYLRNVIGISLALPDAQADRFAEQLECFGYESEEVGQKTIFHGPEIDITVIRGTAPILGITELTLSLMRNKTGQMVYRFGSKSRHRFKAEE